MLSIDIEPWIDDRVFINIRKAKKTDESKKEAHTILHNSMKGNRIPEVKCVKTLEHGRTMLVWASVSITFSPFGWVSICGVRSDSFSCTFFGFMRRKNDWYHKRRIPSCVISYHIHTYSFCLLYKMNSQNMI